jgi:hypothetical protein
MLQRLLKRLALDYALLDAKPNGRSGDGGTDLSRRKIEIILRKASFAGGTEAQIDFTREGFWARLMPYGQGDLKSHSHQKRGAKWPMEKQKEGRDRAVVTGVFEPMFEFGCKDVIFPHLRLLSCTAAV